LSDSAIYYDIEHHFMTTATARPRRPLVIVESPAKAKTIGKILGSDFIVEASYGHVRDLPEGADDVPKDLQDQEWATLGIDVANGFKLLYVVSPEKRKQVAVLKKALAEADALYLATDGDREGEAISWHLVELLEPKVPVHRLVFHEITRTAIEAGMKNAHAIDAALVDAQETRRIVDRLVGFKVSPLLWHKIAFGLSAGRVQSVALRLLVERERERMAFRSAQWWDLTGDFDASEVKESGFRATLTSVGGIRLVRGGDFDPTAGRLAKTDLLLLDGDAATALQDRLARETFTVASREDEPYKASPKAPFTTSSLQQEAGRKLSGFTAKRTMKAAQRLYEAGYITYMRTDSTHLADEAVMGIRKAVERLYGMEYVPALPRHYKTKVANAQEAHEAIRPAGTDMPSPESLRPELGDDEYRLYELIWKRTVASQMADARGQSTTLKLASTSATGPVAVFHVAGRTIEFAGFTRAYVEGSDDPEGDLAATDTILPAVAVGDQINCNGLEIHSHDTQPRARYTEASLTKKLEQLGIGRPSTYASIIDTLLVREYCRKRGTALVPTWTGFAIAQLMSEGLPHLVDYEFTAQLEEQLDAISRGKQDRLDFLTRFYFGDGRPGLEDFLDDLEKTIDPRQACSVKLPSGIVVRVGKHGPFIQFEGKNLSLPPEDRLAPDELTDEVVATLAAGDQPLGLCPKTKKPVYKKLGPHGSYVQLGDNGDPEIKRCSLLKGMTLEDVDLAMALRLLELPRTLGVHPEVGKPVTARIGKHGPYIACGEETRSLPADLSPLDVTCEQAMDLLAVPKPAGKGARSKAITIRTLGDSSVTGKPIEIKDGKFGLYVTDGKTNATLPKDTPPEAVTLDQALEMIATRPPKKRRRR
jgi:DNA topoisomerase-1